MWRDIYLFGDMMKREFFGGQLVFHGEGRLILHALCTLVNYRLVARGTLASLDSRVCASGCGVLPQPGH
jgi:hypothetical protein